MRQIGKLAWNVTKSRCSKVEVLILCESKIGYLYWRTGGLSGGVDENFEPTADELLRILHLSISESCILSSSDQYYF